MNDKKDNGKFNLDFEETVLLTSRKNMFKKFLQTIHEKARKLLNDRDVRNLPETTKDEIKDIRDISKTSSED